MQATRLLSSPKRMKRFILMFPFVSYYFYIPAGGVTIYFQSNNKVPIQGNSLQLSCLVNTTSQDVSYDTTWYTPTNVSHGKCYRQEMICTGGTMTRQLTVDVNGSYMNIQVLNWILDEGRWRCVYTSTGLKQVQADLNVTVYIRVTEAFLQQNNQNITSTLTVNSGEPVTLTCVTGTSRPDPIFGWYIGSRSIGSGTSLIFTPSNTDHNEVIFCQAYNIDPNLKVDSNKPRLFVRVRVLTVTLEGSTGGTKVFTEGYPQTLKCNTSPSRPVPIIRWLLGNKIMTDNIINISMTDGDELYVLKSEITLVLMRNSSNQKIQCEGYISGQETSPVSTEVTVDVRYAPDVRVSIAGNTVVSSTLVLVCVPQGNPPQYTFHPWIHTVGQTEIRRLDGVNTVNNSTLTLSNISIQDTGNYTCIVDNAIPGLDRQVNQTGYEDVDVQGLPVSDKIQLPFAGEPNNSTNIEIRFYSYPPIKSVKFINQSNLSELSNTSNIAIFLQPSNISMMFYEKKVMRLGHVAVLHFRNLTVTDFVNYTLQLSNDQGTVTLPFDFIVAVAPSMPKKFFFINIQDGNLVFGIEKGFNGGHEQIFIVEYQRVGMPDTTWSIFMISENALEDSFANGTYYLKILKIPDGQYIFKIHAENKKGKSSSIELEPVEIKTAVGRKLEVKGSTDVAAIAGGIGAAVVVVVILVVLFVIWRRKTPMLKIPSDEKFSNSVQGRSNQTGNLNANTSYTGDVSNTGYESLQANRTEASPYQILSSGNTETNDQNKDCCESMAIGSAGAGTIYMNTAITSPLSDKEYESLQSNQIETNLYQELNDCSQPNKRLSAGDTYNQDNSYYNVTQAAL